MAADQRLIQDLTQLGLTTYEARAYVGLLGRGAFTAAEVARQSELPRQRIYDVLGSLVEKGLASTRPGSSVKYAALAPRLAIERLVAVQRAELHDLERSAETMIDALTPAFESGRSQTDPLDYIEVLRDTGAINERFTELQANIKDEILVFTKPPYAKPPEENVEGLEVTRSHRARAVYEMNAFDNPDWAVGIRRFVEAGEDARFVERLPLKLVIIDETIVMFGMEDPVGAGQDITIMVVEHPSLAKVLKTAFEATWAQGLTLDEAERKIALDRSQTA